MANKSVNKYSMDGSIKIVRNGAVLTVTIDRPERKNAITAAMWREIAALFTQAPKDDVLRAIILRGAGADFSAGADISEFDSHRGEAATAALYEADNEAAFAAVRHCALPVIAEIRGICFGGGFGLAAAAHLRLADNTVRFRVPAARLGLAYPVHSVADIVQGVGPQAARRLLLCAEELSAEDMLHCGFLAGLYANDGLEAASQTMAQNIAANAPLSVAASQLAITHVLAPSPERLEAALDAANKTFESNDYKEGRAAFMAKRAPVFKGQ